MSLPAPTGGGGGSVTSPSSLAQARIICSWVKSHCFT